MKLPSSGLSCAVLLLALAGVAAIRPLHTATESTLSVTPGATPPWPASFEGADLMSAPLLPIEVRFAESFPGTCAAFSDGNRRLVFRQITQPTRKLHPAEDCLRAAGFSVKHTAAFRHSETGLWGAIEATKDGRSIRVREHITSADGTRTWTDVSAWYWDAQFHAGTGPWLAITVIEPLAAGPR